MNPEGSEDEQKCGSGGQGFTLYHEAHTRVRLPAGNFTNDIPIERGTIRGDALSPFLFLIYMEPLLRWLHSGGHGYDDGCLSKSPQAPDLQIYTGGPSTR
eukprot:scaffold165193_cov17-Tisochrysis_lutea.AAC.1